MMGHCSRFDQGGEVRVGLIGVSHSGISIALPGRAPARLPWTKIAFYNMESGCLLIETTDQAQLRLPTSRIPNLSVLLHVFEQLAGRKAPRLTNLLASLPAAVK